MKLKQCSACIALLFTFIFHSCERSTEWPYDAGQLPLLVVEGRVSNWPETHEVILSLPITAPGSQPSMVSGASVYVTAGDSIYPFLEDAAHPGHYFSDSIAFPTGQLYTLTIIYAGDTLQASDLMENERIFEPLRFALVNDRDSLYSISYVCPAYDPENFALYEIELDWRHVDGFHPINSFAKLYFYTLGTLDMGEIAGNDFESVRFPKGTIVRERRYSISDQYAGWLREILLETQWNNGIIMVQPGNAVGNFGTEVAGYFSACGVSEWNGVVE